MEIASRESSLVPPADMRKELARISAAFSAVLLSADENFARLIVERMHVKMAVGFLETIYSEDNCALDDYSEIQRLSSQLTDYDQVAAAFLKKREDAKHDEEGRGIFSRAIFILRISNVVRREDLAEQVGCSIESIKNMIKVLKRFNLIGTTRDGYVKKPKFNKFLRRFLKEHKDFFDEDEFYAMEEVSISGG